MESSTPIDSLKSSVVTDKTRQARRSIHLANSPETNAVSQYDHTASTMRRSFLDLRSVAISQLETFYLPFMKQVYNSTAQKLGGSVKSPEEIIHSLREIRGGELNRRELEMKDAKINDLQSKVSALYEQLKQFKPESEIAVDLRGLEDGEKKIRRLENLLRIRNQEMFFRFKVKAVGLLEEFGCARADIDGVQQLATQDSVFQFLSGKLKLRLKELRTQHLAVGEEMTRDRMEKTQYQENIRYLTETNDLLRNNERRAREKVEELKKQWRVACERVISSEKLHQEKDSELFRMKKIIEQKQFQLQRLPALQKSHNLALEQLRREHQNQSQSMRTLLNDYNIEINQLRSHVQNKDDQIEEHIIRATFVQEEFERVNREQLRWKERHQATQKDADNKRKELEKKYQELEERVQAMGVEPEEVGTIRNTNQQLKDSLQEIEKEKKEIMDKVKELEGQLSISQASLIEMQTKNKEIQSSLAALHQQKIELSEIIKEKEAEKVKLQNATMELQNSIAVMLRDKTERQKGYEQQISVLQSHNKQLQSTLATTHRDKAELSEKLRSLESFSPRKSQVESNAAIQNKYKSQLAHEQTLRQALILQAVSVKQVEHMEKIRALSEAHNKRVVALQQSFEKKMKGWQNSHDDRFLEELARLTEENAALKDKLVQSEKVLPAVMPSMLPPSFQSQEPPARKGMEIVRTRAFTRDYKRP